MSVTTRWWWIRHAPVPSNGRIYGQCDLSADCSDQTTFENLARALPDGALWVTSQLARTKETAAAILAQSKALGRLAPEAEVEMMIEPLIIEQHFGTWQGLTHDELAQLRGDAWHRFWLAPAHHAPPEGESFAQVMERVGEAVEQLTAAHAGRDIVAVAHGGSIRAALAKALGLEPDRALSFAIDNCSLTRIDHFAGPSTPSSQNDAAWRVHQVNVPPHAAL